MFRRRRSIDHNDKVKNHSIYKNRMIFWITMVYVSTIVLQFLEDVLYVQASIFTALMILHSLLYKYPYQMKNRYSSFYFFLQCTIIFVSAFIMPHGSPIVLIGLLPILIAESIHFFENSFKVLLAVILLYLPYTFIVSLNYGIQKLPFYIPILFFIIAISAFYSILYVKQANAWANMQYYIRKLEAANQKIEELTIVNERKRLARDLHDTLAQGLVGLIMKLEAIDVHIQHGNKERSSQIVKESMHQARIALKEAREAIDDLRSISNVSIVQKIEEEIKKFMKTTSIQVKTTIGMIPELPDKIDQNVMYMISECLTNITKHAQATKVNVTIFIENKELCIQIADNGVGFNTNIIESQKGHYGLIGINERTRLLNGTITITSNEKAGTSVKMKIPLG
ncbi:sensor histidine kinase [Metabacillus halosaccharovorans]|uniref:sensor histidine kinase n=1 Tax=Metabacillus halosaccharovorans TaxID=930124 RepID=UPI001C1F9A38|nr:sensor histidine kinase [Metabacillus halosaccharovorans]MBU7591143.1 sensor histidine kinase [Metabacillus halosaccharovorans]